MKSFPCLTFFSQEILCYHYRIYEIQILKKIICLKSASLDVAGDAA